MKMETNCDTYYVIYLCNDNKHTMPQVIADLSLALNIPNDLAIKYMKEAHRDGKAPIFVYNDKVVITKLVGYFQSRGYSLEIGVI